jgi:putative FmdB family regulatory protein
MPTYEFWCHQCDKTFELSSSVAGYERQRKEGMRCPTCGSSEVEQKISSFQVKTSKKS